MGLSKVEDEKQVQRMAVAGLGQGDAGQLIANPLQNGTNRPTTAASFNKTRESHVEAEVIDLPNDPALRGEME